MLRASSCGFGHDSSPLVTLPQDPCHSFPIFFFLPYALHMFVISFFFFFKLPYYISLCSKLSAMGFLVCLVPGIPHQCTRWNAFTAGEILFQHCFQYCEVDRVLAVKENSLWGKILSAVKDSRPPINLLSKITTTFKVWLKFFLYILVLDIICTFLTMKPLSGCIFESPSQLSRKKVGCFGRSLMQVLPVSLFKITVFFNMSPDLAENLTASCASTTILLYLILILGRELWGLPVLSLPSPPPFFRHICYKHCIARQFNSIYSFQSQNETILK